MQYRVPAAHGPDPWELQEQLSLSCPQLDAPLESRDREARKAPLAILFLFLCIAKRK